MSLNMNNVVNKEKDLILLILQMLSSSKTIITQSSYVPGHQFPEKEEELEGKDFCC